MGGTTASAIPRSKLVTRQEVAERTFAFHFEKPPDFTFKAGQALDLTLLDPPETDAEGNTRAFSIAGLMVATRLRDTAFKRVLSALPPGLAVKIEGLSGDLTLHDNVKRTAVFLEGGIGHHAVPKHRMPRGEREALPHRILHAHRQPDRTDRPSHALEVF